MEIHVMECGLCVFYDVLHQQLAETLSAILRTHNHILHAGFFPGGRFKHAKRCTADDVAVVFDDYEEMGCGRCD